MGSNHVSISPQVSRANCLARVDVSKMPTNNRLVHLNDLHVRRHGLMNIMHISELLSLTIILAIPAGTRDALKCPRLLMRARQIPGARLGLGFHFWTGAEQLSFISSDKIGVLHILHLNTKTGRKTKGISIDPKLASLSDVLPDTWRVSPNGQWLLWANWRTQKWVAAALSGAQHFEWPLHRTTNSFAAAWLRDNRKWVEIVTQAGGTKVWIHAVGPSQPDRYRYLPNLVYTGWLLGITSGNKAVFGIWPHPEKDPQWRGACLSIDLNASLGPVHKYLLNFPPRVEFLGIILSPGGNEFAWVFHTKSRHSPEKIGLWISRADGSQMKEVGCLNYDPQTFQHWSDTVAWKPNGSQLSFSWRNALWSVPTTT